MNAEGTSATVQLQTCDIGAGHWVRCFKLQLDQDGDDVKAKALWCRYARYPDKASYYGRDWDDADISINGEYNASDFSTAVNGSGIGVTNIKPLFDVDLEGTLPSGRTVLNGRRVTFRPTQAITIASAFTGEVQEVVFKGYKPDVREYHQDGWVMTNEEVLVAQNTSIATIRFKSAIMCGKWVACDNPSAFGSYSSISGDTLTMQVQCYEYKSPSNQYTKVVFVEFRQAGKDVYMRAVAMGNKAGDYRGTSSVSRSSDPVCTAGSLSDRGPCNGGYGIYDVTFTYTPDTWPLTFSASTRDILDKGARYVFDGVDATGNQNTRFADNSTIILTNNSSLTSFKWQDSVSLVISTGCEVTVNTDWALTEKGSLIMTIDGGTFRVKNSCYANYVTLANGGRVFGSLMRVGAFNHTNATTTLSGSPCYIEKLNGSQQKSGYAIVPFSNWHEFRLAADLYVGGIDDVSGSWVGLNWEKKGPADLHITKASGTIGSFRIREGAIVLDSDGALGKTNALELAGGEIAVGAFTNRLGALSVTANSSIRAGDGALTFSDSSAAVWTPGATLSVTGEASRLASGYIRFLRENGAAGLSDSQLRAMRYNGELRVRLDGEGWLESYIPGLTVIFR